MCLDAVRHTVVDGRPQCQIVLGGVSPVNISPHIFFFFLVSSSTSAMDLKKLAGQAGQFLTRAVQVTSC